MRREQVAVKTKETPHAVLYRWAEHANALGLSGTRLSGSGYGEMEEEMDAALTLSWLETMEALNGGRRDEDPSALPPSLSPRRRAIERGGSTTAPLWRPVLKLAASGAFLWVAFGFALAVRDGELALGLFYGFLVLVTLGLARAA